MLLIACRLRCISWLHAATAQPTLFSILLTEQCNRAVPRLTHNISVFAGKAEGKGTNWHGHVTAVTVAPDFRRIGLAERLMGILEETTHKTHNAYFVDLFVRCSNAVAIGMYEKFGYVVYRRVLGYYSQSEDAFDMRKAMPRDVSKQSVVPLDRPIRPHELEFD